MTLLALGIGIFTIITKITFAGWMTFFGGAVAIFIIVGIHIYFTYLLKKTTLLHNYLLFLWQLLFLTGAFFQYDGGDSHGWTVLDGLLGKSMDPLDWTTSISTGFQYLASPLIDLPWYTLGRFGSIVDIFLLAWYPFLLSSIFFIFLLFRHSWLSN